MTVLHPWVTAPRVDAQASEDRNRDGWLGTRTGRRRTPRSLEVQGWYRLEIARPEWPWIFERGENPAQVISTIDALAVLMALTLFHGDDARGALARTQMIP